MGGESRFATVLDVFLLPVAAQRDAWELVPAAAEPEHQFVAAAVRQTQVADQQVEAMLVGQFERGGQVSRRLHTVPLLAKHPSHHLRRGAERAGAGSASRFTRRHILATAPVIRGTS